MYLKGASLALFGLDGFIRNLVDRGLVTPVPEASSHLYTDKDAFYLIDLRPTNPSIRSIQVGYVTELRGASDRPHCLVAELVGERTVYAEHDGNPGGNWTLYSDTDEVLEDELETNRLIARMLEEASHG